MVERRNSKRDREQVESLSRAFAALGDPTRRALVSRLASSDATVTELAEPHGVSLQAISKHLMVLEDAGLISKTRDGKHRTVHLEAEVFDLMTRWIERYRREAEARYQRLDTMLAEMSDNRHAKGHNTVSAPTRKQA